ncbi:YciI family protein [Deinococcus sp.]|uniref:YciI family protein n=1 Tax=Deinococcus sp. TaxID=47478 RepID=UPI003CC58611
MSAPTLFVVASRYLKPLEKVSAVTPRHREWLDQHYRSGLFLVSGRKADSSGGVIIARAETQAELEAVFAQDPFVLEGCSEYSYAAFTPVKRGRGIEIDGVPLVE